MALVQKFDVEITGIARVTAVISVKAASQEAADAIVQARIENDNDDFSDLNWAIDDLAEVEINATDSDSDDDEDDDDEENEDEDEADDEETTEGEDVV